jgi:Trk K+ transport system NAD-binding subunit
VIAFARYSFEAKKLYKQGVDVVIIPRILAGEKLKNMLSDVISGSPINEKEFKQLMLSSHASES